MTDTVAMYSEDELVALSVAASRPWPTPLWSVDVTDALALRRSAQRGSVALTLRDPTAEARQAVVDHVSTGGGCWIGVRGGSNLPADRWFSILSASRLSNAVVSLITTNPTGLASGLRLAVEEAVDVVLDVFRRYEEGSVDYAFDELALFAVDDRALVTATRSTEAEGGVDAAELRQAVTDLLAVAA